MDAFPESTVCLICLQTTGKNIFVAGDASANILKNCNTYLHSTLTKETLKDIRLKNENQLPMCKSCFDSAMELTQLSEQLQTLQKEISDLSAEFSLTVFHRRSQVYKSPTHNDSQEGVNKSSIIELNVSCLPSNIFFTNYEATANMQDESYGENDENIFIDDCTDNSIVITNLKYESSDLQLDNLTESIHSDAANSDTEQPCIGESQDGDLNLYNHESPTDSFESSDSEITIIETTGNNESVDSTNFKNSKQLTTSDLMKVVTVPQLNIQSGNVTEPKASTSSTSSYQKKSNPRKQLLVKTKYNDNDYSNYDCTSSNSNGEKSFKCLYCEKTFHESILRDIHHKTHTDEENPYTCSFCNKRFARNASLELHKKRNHTGDTGEKLHACSLCNKSFTTIHILRCHERIHTGERPYQCSFCKKRFTRLTDLKSHERTHTGEKPYKCAYCDKKFAHISSRNAHQKYHCSHRREPLFLTCSICKVECASLTHLKYHEKTHTVGGVGLKCSFCELTFAQDEDRIVHEKTHSVKEEVEEVIVGM